MLENSYKNEKNLRKLIRKSLKMTKNTSQCQKTHKKLTNVRKLIRNSLKMTKNSSKCQKTHTKCTTNDKKIEKNGHNHQKLNKMSEKS